MDYETLFTQDLDKNGELVRTSVMLRDDQIESIKELSGAPRSRGGRGWSSLHREVLDIGIAFKRQQRTKAQTKAKV